MGLVNPDWPHFNFHPNSGDPPMGIVNPQQNRNGSVSVLGDIRSTVAAAQQNVAGTGTAGSTDRKPSEFWLNVGVVLPGAGKDGDDLFVSLPVGIALDDMKPVQVRGNNADFVNLQQAKNALLESLQQGAADLTPGDRIELPQLSVELYRKGNPAQTGNAESNPLIANMARQLSRQGD